MTSSVNRPDNASVRTEQLDARSNVINSPSDIRSGEVAVNMPVTVRYTIPDGIVIVGAILALNGNVVFSVTYLPLYSSFATIGSPGTIILLGVSFSPKL